MLQKTLVLLLLVLITVVNGTLGIKPPRILIEGTKVGKEVVVDISKSTTLTLTCEGQQDMEWNHNMPEGFFIIINTNNNDGAEYSFVSTLNITDAYMEDTGYFTCFYSAPPAPTAPPQPLQDNTYVYFHDGEANFATDGQANIVVCNTAEELVLDCRTTQPNIKVTLKKNQYLVTDSFEFDSKIGFTMKKPFLEDGGSYTCFIEHSEYTKSWDVYVKAI